MRASRQDIGGPDRESERTSNGAGRQSEKIKVTMNDAVGRELEGSGQRIDRGRPENDDGGPPEENGGPCG